MTQPHKDPYLATAGAYDLFAAYARPGQLAALEVLFGRLDPASGPVLDVGAGSGLIVVTVLERFPEARVLALEPSPAMRALAVAKVAPHPEWFERVTIRPEDFFTATLPDRISSAIMLGVVGHFDPGERAAVLADLAARLPTGGALLLDLQAPEQPQAVPAYQFTAASIGQLSYRGIAEAWPLEGERMRWRMTYLTLDGERVLVEDTVEHVYHHPSPGTLIAEASQVGLHAERLPEETFWLLTRL